MRIAVCDDERSEVERLVGFIKTSRPDYRVTAYTSGAALRKDCKNGIFYDVLFLDIMLKEENGYDLAREIRKKNKSTVLVFLTNSVEYVFQGYEVNAFRYIQKPISPEECEKLLQEIEGVFRSKDKAITVSTKDGTEVIPLHQILYFESFDKYISVHLPGRVVEYRGKLYDVEAEAIPYGFAKTHKSYIVNMGHVTAVKADQVVVDGSLTIPLSRYQKQEFWSKFAGFLRGE